MIYTETKATNDSLVAFLYPEKNFYSLQDTARFARWAQSCSHHHHLKILCRVLAQWADELGWELVTDIFVAAYGTAPNCLAGCGCGVRWLWLDVGLVECVCCGRDVGQYFHGRWDAHEESVGSEVGCLAYIKREIGIRSLCDVRNAVFGEFEILEIGELINISAGLEAEVLDELEIGGFAEHGNVAALRLQEHVVRVVGLVHGKSQLIWP